MGYTEKGTVEDFIVQELMKLGWSYQNPDEMKLKRKGNLEPLIIEDLRNSLRKINRRFELTDSDLDFVTVSLRTIPANLEGIRIFLDRFRNGLVVPLQKEGKEEKVRFIDLENIENNIFVVTRQFTVEGLKGGVRPDVVLFVNGIPLVVIECKNPTAEDVDWTNAYGQIKRYESIYGVPDVFKYVQFSVATDGIKTYYFPNSYEEEGKDFLNVWKDTYPLNIKEFSEDLLKILIYGMLPKPNLLDLIENFIFVKKERGKSSKIIARYMQYRTSNKIFRRVVDTLQKKEDRKLGLIWHWLGSGKTYAMAFASWKLLYCPEAKKPSIFVMVDRRDLEEQIENDFSFIGVNIERVSSIRELVNLLTWGNEGKRGIFLVTIEKFSPQEFIQLEKEGKKIEITRENVIVFADEVHRTHYGEFATMMRSIFKNAFIFGFTGTPLSKVERNTFQKFSSKDELYLDRYSMLDAIKDGFTVPLSYQGRLPNCHPNLEELNEFIKFEEQELKSLSQVEQKELSTKVSVIKAQAKEDGRIAVIAKDIKEHFTEVVEPTELKAMIITIDREACIKYKRELDKILPPNYTEIVMTYNTNDSGILREYFEALQERWEREYKVKGGKEINDKIIENFKGRKEPKILIVTDMLITGFDAPNLWTMYLDKPLKEHRLLQAIARCDRPFSNKQFGLINDYIGVLKELDRAFEKFEASDARSLRLVIRDLSRDYETFQKLIEEASQIFAGIERKDTRESLRSVVGVLKVDPNKGKFFETKMEELMKKYEMLSGEPFLKDYLLEYKWLIKVYVAYYKDVYKKNIDELKIERLSKKTVQLIQHTIDVKEIDEAFPIVSVDEKYIEYLRKTVPKGIGPAIDVIGNDRNEVRKHLNSPFFLNLSKEVEKAYRELINRKAETKEVSQKLIEISERIVEWKREEEQIGKDKYPIYEAMKIMLPDVDKQRLVSTINDIIIHLKSLMLLFEGWQIQRGVRQKVRTEIRLQLLIRFKDYRNKIDDLTEAIFFALEGMK